MRKTIDVVIHAEGRDKGKRFVVTEMSAIKLDKWLNRAILAITASGNIVPADVLQQGIVGLVAFAIQALTSASFKEAEPLMEEMLRCVKVKPDPSNALVVRDWFEEDFEEYMTLQTLRLEVMQLHVNFSIREEWSKFLGAFRLASQEGLSNMQTSDPNLAG